MKWNGEGLGVLIIDLIMKDRGLKAPSAGTLRNTIRLGIERAAGWQGC